MAQIFWKQDALTDLKEQLEHYREFSPAYAEKLNDSVFARVEHLRHSPKMGRVVPEFCDETIRELIVPPLRVIYLVDTSDRCIVCTVIHSSRDLSKWIDPHDLKSNES
jgi:plasmid stabilization system protein ParE